MRRISSTFRGVVVRNAIPHGRINNPTYKFPSFLRRYDFLLWNGPLVVENSVKYVKYTFFREDE